MISVDFVKVQNKIITGHGDIINEGLLESAFSSYYYYDKPEEQIVSIYRGILKNHAFRDGNKRTACIVLLSLCELCNINFDKSDLELGNISIKVAENNYDVETITNLLFELKESMYNYKTILSEIKQSSEEEYIKTLQDYYGDDDLMNLVLASEEMLGQFIDTNMIQTEKTDDDNLIIRYYEDDDQVIILGMISKTGKLSRNELVELRVWMGRLKDKMKTGVPVISSMNNLSMPIFNRIVNDLEKEGYTVNKTTFNTTKIKDQTWITYMFEVEI